nr:MAG TPA: UcrQ family protein [Caudoviricetes sp.]
MNLNNVRGNRNGNIGRRSAFPHKRMSAYEQKVWAALHG